MTTPSPPLSNEGLGHSSILVGRARAGDRAALDELFARYYEPVHRIARIRLGARLRAFIDCQDLVQEVFLNAQQGLDRFEVRSHSSIIRWLSAILENRIRDAYKRAHAQKRGGLATVPLEADERSDDAEPELASPATSPSLGASRNELRELYDQSVAELTGEAREVVVLRDIALSSWEEIADALGRPSPEAARELYRRTQSRLADLLDRHTRGG